jgi:RimJ/RimL family protein N-acetyltransferase
MPVRHYGGTVELRTERLILRRWTPADLKPFAQLNADPEVMRYFPRVLSRAESDAVVERTEGFFDELGLGLWAVELPGTGFLGFTGLSIPRFEAAFTPAVEVGWRLARQAWGYGYATEAARASLADGFGRVGLKEIVSFTAAVNRPSLAVMERLGMTHDPADDFDHPVLAEDSPLRRHVLYRTNHLAFG